MNEKQQQLTFEKGITNVPSDALCSDNALADCVGLVYDDGEHRVIQRPRELFTTTDGVTILYVHTFNNTSRYIGYFTYEDNTHQEKTVYGYYVEDEETHTLTRLGVLDRTGGRIDHLFYQEGVKITSIGKTLIVSDGDGLHYFLWNSEGYKSLGSELPAPSVKFRLDGWKGWKDEMEAGSSIYQNEHETIYRISDHQKWNDVVIGLYSRLKKKLSLEKYFYGSFCVRTALELHDGTYHLIGQPIFMLNNFSDYLLGSIAGSPTRLLIDVYGQLLSYNHDGDYSEWSDVVKNVCIFVTRQYDPFETSLDALLIRPFYPDISHQRHITSNRRYDYEKKSWDGYEYEILPGINSKAYIDIVQNGVYYKLCNIGLIGDGKWHSTSDHYDIHTLENLTTQDQLTNDDFYGRTKLVADYIYAYNSRLNIADVSRGFFEGYDNFLPYDNSSGEEYRFYVTIKTDSGEKVIKHTAKTAQKQGIWFYYPDPRASHVVIAKAGTGVILDEDLTEHPGLNGAYYFRGLPTEDYIETAVSGVEEPTEINNGDVELLPNYIIQSEVNNPFTFAAAGYHKVSTGKIFGMSSTTMALSQDQFGQTDLIVFSDTGLWGMKVDRTGAYNSIHSISRDVCINPKSITQTDGAVVFATAKGLMVVSENGVSNLSEQLFGKSEAPFLDYLRTAFIAYDYRDSLLWLFNGSRYCYVYALRSKTFARYYCGENIVTNVLNDYPDYLLQAGTSVCSLLKRKDINDPDERGYTAMMTSRPMKLENGLALKSIMQVRHITDMEGRLTLRIFASNNLKDWVELHSLRGIPWKYYRFRYDFADLLATDRFAGTVLVTQERRTNKLRL